MAKTTKDAPRGPVWEGPDYPRVSAGRYLATVTRVQGPELIRRYRRWSLLVEFQLLSEPEHVRVCAFFNMGQDPARPRVGRNSRYFRAWTMANGELPRKGQQMTANTFQEGQLYEV